MKRTLRSLAVCVLVGVLLTIAIAWSAALFAPLSPWGASGPSVHFEWMAPPTWGAPQFASRARLGFGTEDWSGDWALYQVDGDPALRAVTLLKKGVPVEVADRRLVIIHLEGGSAGWPCRALYWRGPSSAPPWAIRDGPIIRDPGEEAAASSAVRPLTRISLTSTSEPRPIPIHPLWPGLIADVALFTALAACLWIGLPMLRRARRRRNRRSLECVYTIHDLSICPECGTAGTTNPQPSKNATAAPRSAQSA